MSRIAAAKSGLSALAIPADPHPDKAAIKLKQYNQIRILINGTKIHLPF